MGQTVQQISMLLDACSVQTIAAERLDLPVKKATAYRAMALAKATVFGGI